MLPQTPLRRITPHSRMFFQLLNDDQPEIRVAAVYAFGQLSLPSHFIVPALFIGLGLRSLVRIDSDPFGELVLFFRTRFFHARLPCSQAFCSTRICPTRGRVCAPGQRKVISTATGMPAVELCLSKRACNWCVRVISPILPPHAKAYHTKLKSSHAIFACGKPG